MVDVTCTDSLSLREALATKQSHQRSRNRLRNLLKRLGTGLRNFLKKPHRTVRNLKNEIATPFGLAMTANLKKVHFLKKLSILGSTGSIGINTLDVVSNSPDKFDIIGLAAGTNFKLLSKQIRVFKPKIVSVLNDRVAIELKKLLVKNCKPEIVYGSEGLALIASLKEVDLVVSAIVGSDGLVPTFTAIRNGKHIALANKETLVMAGKIVMKEARKHNVKIIPVDSEHSAIFQSLRGHKKKHLKSVILTASGGPFLKYSNKRLANVTPEEALKHPNWKMGKKVTVDSSSLMNKGLEVIEAKWLFDIPLNKIKVYIHPQSIVHAMVEYIDGSVIAQLSNPDMRGPISYALSQPERINTKLPSLNWISYHQITKSFLLWVLLIELWKTEKPCRQF